ncbi:MAG: hypothetical protein IPP37_09380 [Saprospiraceae bacterium]|nr:hypothetical protein [Saprospiraceae bacterium]
MKTCNNSYLRLTIVFMYVLFFMAQGITLLAQEWERVKLADYPYSIQFPGKPEVKQKLISTTLGEQGILSVTFKPETDDPVFFYSLQLVEYPEGTYHQDSVELIHKSLDESLLALAETLKCKVTYQSDIDNHASRIFRLEDSLSKQTVKGKMYLDKDTLIYCLLLPASKKAFTTTSIIFWIPCK